MLADYPYLLAPGTVIPSQGSYRSTAGDTLASVAARFATPVPALGAAVAGVAGLLAAGVQIPLSRGGSYTTAPGDTLAGIAAAQGLTVAGLAADAGPVPGLLVAGIAIELPAYTVASGDTLASVTAHFPVTVAELGGALADTAGLLEPGAAVNLVRRSYPLADDDTLFTAISYLALDVSTAGAQADAVDNFATMNATLPDLFAAGTTLLVPEPVTVAASDTIAGLAAAHGLTPLQLGTSIAARTDVLAVGVVITLPAPDSNGRTVTTRSGDSLDGIAATAGLPLDAVSSAVQDLVRAADARGDHRAARHRQPDQLPGAARRHAQHDRRRGRPRRDAVLDRDHPAAHCAGIARRDDGGLPEPGRRLLTVRRQDQPGGQPVQPVAARLTDVPVPHRVQYRVQQPGRPASVPGQPDRVRHPGRGLGHRLPVLAVADIPAAACRRADRDGGRTDPASGPPGPAERHQPADDPVHGEPHRRPRRHDRPDRAGGRRQHRGVGQHPAATRCRPRAAGPCPRGAGDPPGPRRGKPGRDRGPARGRRRAPARAQRPRSRAGPGRCPGRRPGRRRRPADRAAAAAL